MLNPLSLKEKWQSAISRVEQKDTMFYECPIRRFLKVRCPGCGMGHATLALLRGDWKTAYRRHPLVFVVIPLLVLGVIDVARQFAPRMFNKPSRDSR